MPNDSVYGNAKTPEEISSVLAQNGVNVSTDYIKVSENGNVQITMPGSEYVSITYNYNVKPEYGVTFKTGDGGQFSSSYINNNLETSTTPQNHVSTIYLTAFSGDENANNFAANVKNVLGLNNPSDSGSNGYNIYGGSSAGAEMVLENAAKDSGHFDLVFCDAAYDGSHAVNRLLQDDYADLRAKMVKDGSFIFAYEGNNVAGGDFCGNPQDAVDNYMKLIVDSNGNVKEDAINVVVGLNDNLLNHGISSNYNGGYNLSPEHLISDGTMSKIAKGFDPNIATPTSVEGDGTRYFFLKTPEFIYGDYVLEVKDGYPSTFVTKDGSRDLAKTEAELNLYIKSARSYVTDTFLDIGKIDQLSSFENSKGPSNLANLSADRYELVRTNYNSVSSSANAMINNLNNTTCANKGISDYQITSGTSAFPGSLNDSNAFLYGITGKLMSDMKTEVASIEQMLNNYATLDASLAYKASSLNYVSTPGYATSIDFSKLSVPEMDSKFTDLFSNKIQEGRVGSVSASDIQSMLSPNGIIMSGLSNEITDAKNLGNSIQNLINNTNIEGQAWTELKIHLNDYKLACEVRAQAANTLQLAYTQALTLVSNYISPDSSLDDSRIPEINVKMRGIKQTISALRQQANTPVYESHYDIWTKSYYEVATYPYKYLLDRIPALDAEYDELNAEVTKLQGLAEVMNEANDIVARAMAEVNSTYATAVGAINPATVGPSVVSL